MRVSGSAPTPCASRFCVSRRMSSPARFSSSIESAACSPSFTSRIDTRCSANRSRSLITPSGRPFSTTTIWRMPRSAITCIASYAVADAGSVTIGADITSASGVASGRSGSTTRRSRSTSVNIPTGAPPVVDDDDRAHLASAIVCAASRSVAVAGQATGGVPHELGERARQRLLFGRALAVLAVEALERLLQRLGDRLRAVALELRRLLRAAPGSRRATAGSSTCPAARGRSWSSCRRRTARRPETARPGRACGRDRPACRWDAGRPARAGRCAAPRPDRSGRTGSSRSSRSTPSDSFGTSARSVSSRIRLNGA